MRPTLRSQRDRISDMLLFGLMGLLPLVAVFGYRGVAPWLLLVSFPAFVRGDFWQSAYGQLFDRPEPAEPFFASFLAIILFCVWIFLSGFWSPHQEPSLAFNVLGPVLVGAIVIWLSLQQSPLWARRVAAAYVAAVVVGVFLLLFEGVTGGALRRALPPAEGSLTRDMIALGRGVTVFMPALFPAAIIVYLIWGRRLYALGFVALGLVAAVSHDITANTGALVVGLSAGLLAVKMSGRAINIIAYTIVALLISMPVLAMLLPVEAIFAGAGDVLPPSWLHRIAVWQSVGAHITQGLPFGFGADFAREWKETAPLINVPNATIALSLMPTHPHNVFLQIWLELGVPGVTAFAVFVLFGARALTRAAMSPLVVAGLAGAVGAITFSMLVEASIWQVWRLAAMALAGMGVALSYSINRKQVR